MGQGTGIDGCPTDAAIRPAGYDVSAWVSRHQHIVRPGGFGGHGDVPLIHLPLRCRCGSDQFGIIVGAAAPGSGSLPPAQPAMPR
jgi:hypothetical protein